jgi:predicted ATP-dependent endonuclease of OLD family
MAHIERIAIRGLGGRDELYECSLDRSVNVFYGANGSGKTMLLKVLHAALDNNIRILSGLPITYAAIDCYFEKYSQTFKRTIHRELTSQKPEAQSDDKSWSLIAQVAQTAAPKPEWTSDPEEPGGTSSWKHGYLPISRLYRGLPKGRYLTTQKLSEDELDETFENALQAVWANYASDITTAVKEIQEKGLTAILRSVFSDPAESYLVDAHDANKTYESVRKFLDRQSSGSDIVKDEKQFTTNYQKKPQVRTVANSISRMELQIERQNAPRELLRTLLEEMFSSRKEVVFDDKEIQIKALGQNLKLRMLSSGEKQLILIALEALVTRNHVLLIDEPELSMHIDWQKRLIPLLIQLNPSMQLIIATHSPEIMEDLQDKYIIRLWED